MHCGSCVLITEGELSEINNVKSAKAKMNEGIVEIEADFGERTDKEILDELNMALDEYGYTLSLEKNVVPKKWKDLFYAFPLAIVFMILFIVLQKMGIVNLVNAEKITLPTVFLLGIIASLSSCMAVVGGLVLSMSATFAKEGDKFKPQILFHLGRLLSFFLLGGLIGVIGDFFILGRTSYFVLGLISGLIMLILGLNLLDVFHFAKRIQFTLPKFISLNLLKIRELNHSLVPFLIGAITFFLPCGFTQSMQIYSLSIGGFVSGASIMFVFALGTLPILSLMSFSSVGLKSEKVKSIFFKTTGLVVIFFALLNILSGMTAYGILPPLFNL